MFWSPIIAPSKQIFGDNCVIFTADIWTIRVLTYTCIIYAFSSLISIPFPLQSVVSSHPVGKMLPETVPEVEPSFWNRTVTWKQTRRGVKYLDESALICSCSWRAPPRLPRGYNS